MGGSDRFNTKTNSQADHVGFLINRSDPTDGMDLNRSVWFGWLNSSFFFLIKHCKFQNNETPSYAFIPIFSANIKIQHSSDPLMMEVASNTIYKSIPHNGHPLQGTHL